MLAGGTGITPFYQILQAAYINNDTPQFTLIFGNKTTNDILMKEELDNLVSSQKFNFDLKFLIDKEEPGWKDLVGYVSKDMLMEHFPSPANDVLVLLCGPPVMCVKAKEFLAEIGHNKDNIFEF